MVNVPGRSKGCNTCRRRKVGCDEGKPKCQRCTKAGLHCLGYERERIWKNAFPAPKLETTTISKIIPMQPQKPSPARELSLIAFHDQICFTFMFANHVWRASGVLWLEHATNGKLGQLSLSATHALSQANFGRSHHQADIERQGVILYGKSLRMLAEQLSDHAPADPKLIVPILIMIMHAGSQADRDGAVLHLRGLARLLHLCGPQAFQTQPLLNAFEAARAILLIAALIGKQRLFLDGAEWRTTPWTCNPSLKTHQSELLDILVIIPGLLQEHESMRSSSQQDQVLLSQLITKVKKQVVELYRWRWKWQTQCAREISTDRSGATLRTHTLGHLERLHFSRFGAAMELMLYNAVLMWLMALMSNIDYFGASKHIDACATDAMPKDKESAKLSSFQPLRRPGAAITVRDPALEICRIFDWVALHHARNTEPGFLYLLPIGMAMTAFKGEPEIVAWVRELLGASPATAGYAQGENQAGFGFYLAQGASLNPNKTQAAERLFSRQDELHLVT